MNCVWLKDLQSGIRTAATFLPPATAGETGWDVLLALHSDQRRELTLEKLAALISVSKLVLTEWLAILELRQLINAAKDGSNDIRLAVLTPEGRELLDRYLTATSALQVGAHH
jgi:DNA-binding MarR family transcriptional regulator